MSLTEFETRITSAVDRIAPSVAVVDSLRVAPRAARLGALTPAQASALVIDRSGTLVTNQHVVEGSTHLVVRLSDGRALEAEVLGGDEVTDVAVVRVDATDLPAAQVGDSEALRVGQIVLAVGNALGLPGGPTVSMGVVSALSRPLPGSDFVFEGLVQTDAAINPGNSGGPLVDLSGSAVGINAAMVPFAQGVGFAIPIHAVMRIADELRRNGRIVRPWIGITVAELGPELARSHGVEPHSGLLVAGVVARSPAHRSGLKPGDILTSIGPFEVRSVRALLEALARFPVGFDVPVSARRRGQPFAVSVPLEEVPAPVGRRA